MVGWGRVSKPLITWLIASKIVASDRESKTRKGRKCALSPMSPPTDPAERCLQKALDAADLEEDPRFEQDEADAGSALDEFTYGAPCTRGLVRTSISAPGSVI